MMGINPAVHALLLPPDGMIDLRHSEGSLHDDGREWANHHYDIVGHYHANNGSSVCKVWARWTTGGGALRQICRLASGDDQEARLHTDDE